MGTLNFKHTGLLTLILIVGFSISTLAGPGKGSKSERLFKIPKKITCVEDLPMHLRAKTQKNETVIQLFPDEIKTEAIAEKVNTEVEPKLNIYDNQDQQAFYVVTGSFVNRPNAEKLTANLKQIGYGETNIEFFEDAGLYRVIVRQYNTEEEAIRYQKDYNKNNPNLEAAWIYEGKDMYPVFYSSAS